MADETKPNATENKPEPFKPFKTKAKVKAHFARGSVTVSNDKLGEFNAVTVFDDDPPAVGSEIDVEVKSMSPQIVGGSAANVVEHAVHVRPVKK